MKMKLIVILVVLVSMFALGGCGADTNDVALENNTNVEGVSNKQEGTPKKAEEQPAATYSREAGRITVYMSGPGSLAKRLEEAFETNRGDVIEVLNASGGSVAKRIWAEMEAGEIHADVVFSSEPSMFMALNEKGMLAQYISPETKALENQYNFGDGYFTPANARYGIIVYNVDNVKKDEVPTSWADLKKPHWNNRLALADATQSATAFAISSGVEQIFDFDWAFFEAMNANNAMLLKSNSQVAEKAKTGEVDAGFLPHDGVLRSINKDEKDGIESPLKIVWPKEGAISIQRPIGIIANESRPEENMKLSKEFVDFILSAEAQEIMRKFGFISVRTDLKLPNGVPSDVHSIVVDWEHLSANEEDIRKSYEKIMGGN
ncbi:MAG: extracellular solute-binding protein [Alkaliphilus sp.]